MDSLNFDIFGQLCMSVNALMIEYFLVSGKN